MFAVAACQLPASPELVGLWESQKTSQGGIGQTFEFRPDGVAVTSGTVMVNTSYRVVGDRLVVGESVGSGRPAESVAFQIHGAALILTRPDGATLRKERM